MFKTRLLGLNIYYKIKHFFFFHSNLKISEEINSNIFLD